MKLKILILCSFFLAGCISPVKEKTVFPDCLPREIEVPGWQLLTENQVPGGDILPPSVMEQYADAIRARYSASYRSFSRESLLVRAQVIHCVTALDAFGLYSLERSGAGPVVHEDDLVYSGERGLFAVRGVYYIRLEQTVTAGKEIGRSEHRAFLFPFLQVITGKLGNWPGADYRPDLLLPKGFSSRDVVYYRNGYGEIEMLKRCYTGNIDAAGTRNPVFFSGQKTSSDATTLFNAILAVREEGFILTSRDDTISAVRKRNDGHFIILSLYKQWIFGVLDADDIHRGNTVLRELRSRLDNLPGQ